MTTTYAEIQHGRDLTHAELTELFEKTTAKKVLSASSEDFLSIRQG